MAKHLNNCNGKLVNSTTKNGGGDGGGGGYNHNNDVGDLKHLRRRTSEPKTSSSPLTLLSFIKSNFLLNLILLLIISILTNSIYLNFFYLPTLRKSIDEQHNHHVKLLELPGHLANTKSSSSSYLSSLFSFCYSFISWPSISSDSSSSASSSSLPSSAYYRHKSSFDHVSFPSLDDYTSPVPLTDETSKSIGLLDDDSDSETKKNMETKRKESQMALKMALSMQKQGKPNKASKLFRYALSLDAANADVLTAYGEYLEMHKKDIVRAEHYYTRVVQLEPANENAQVNLRRAAPIVSKIDRDMLGVIDTLLRRFYDIPATNAALRRAKRDAYYAHIYHSNAIEGNTLNLQQTRHIIENRMAVGGKSVQEHNEVLGLDAAMRYINQTLLYKPLEEFAEIDILEIHRRVLGFCDPIESGKFRKHQVYVGKFTPPPPELVEQLMAEFIDWLNSNQLLQAHPIQIASLVHYKFVYIHPFYDGNGRTARLLMNLILMKFGYPPVIIKKQERLEYYSYLEMANQGDIKPFVRFVARVTQRTLVEYIKMCNDSYSISVDDAVKMYRGDLMLNTNFDFAQDTDIHTESIKKSFQQDDNDGGSNSDDDDDDTDSGDLIGENLINAGKFSFAPVSDDNSENH